MSKFNVKGMLNKVTGTLTKGVDLYTNATNAVEKKIMNVCGSERSMDEAADAGLDVVIVKTVHVGTVVKDKTITASKAVAKKIKDIPMVKMPTLKKKERTQKDVLAELAHDEDLAAALSYIHKTNNCIEVVSVEVVDTPTHTPISVAPSAPVVCDGSAPMARVRINDNIAPVHGVACEPGLTPAPMSIARRMYSFVRKATGTPMAVCIAPNN